MITEQSRKLRVRREYMRRLHARPDTVLIADPQRVQFGVKILSIQIEKAENGRD